MSDLKHRIYAMGKELQLMNVATVSPDNKPRVRYVAGKMDQELNLRFSTHLSSPKIGHLKANPVVSVTLGASHPGSPQWLQVEGRAEIMTSKEEREAFWFDALGAYFRGVMGSRGSTSWEAQVSRIQVYAGSSVISQVESSADPAMTFR